MTQYPELNSNVFIFIPKCFHKFLNEQIWSNMVKNIDHMERHQKIPLPYPEMRCFLDISKAFDKVGHNGFIFKLKCNGISGNLLNFLRIISKIGNNEWS